MIPEYSLKKHFIEQSANINKNFQAYLVAAGKHQFMRYFRLSRHSITIKTSESKHAVNYHIPPGAT